MSSSPSDIVKIVQAAYQERKELVRDTSIQLHELSPIINPDINGRLLKCETCGEVFDIDAGPSAVNGITGICRIIGSKPISPPLKVYVYR